MTNAIETLDDFKRRFEEIKQMGWVTTHRSGNTGIGKTLEDLLGIPENNIQQPDFGIYELKSGRSNRNSMLTLVTKSPDPEKANSNLLNKFGYYSPRSKDKTHKSLHTTIKFGKDTIIFKTEKTLRPDILKNFKTEHGYLETLTLISNFGIEDAFWPIQTIKEVIDEKFGNELVYVLAESRGSRENEQFKFNQAYLLKGINGERIVELIRQEVICIDIRIGQFADGTAHDHGTAFRIKPSDFEKLFNEKMRIDE